MDFMLSILRDPMWGFLGALFAFVAIPLAYWIFVLQRKVKELAFGVLSIRRLFSVDQEVASRIVVLLDGKPISDLHLMVIGLKNSGTEPILASDFAQPMTFNLDAGTAVISAEIAKQSPGDLGFSLQVSDSLIRLDGVLLNAGDYVVIQALLSGSEPKLAPSFRVIGITAPSLLQVSPTRSASNYSSWKLAQGYISWLVVLAATVLIVDDIISDYAPMKVVIYGGAVLLIFAAFILTRLRERYSLKYRRYIEDA